MSVRGIPCDMWARVDVESEDEQYPYKAAVQCDLIEDGFAAIVVNLKELYPNEM